MKVTQGDMGRDSSRPSGIGRAKPFLGSMARDSDSGSNPVKAKGIDSSDSANLDIEESRHIRSRLMQIQLELTRKQVVLDAFDNVREWLDEGHSITENRQMLADILEQARYKQERVLQPYKKRLVAITDKANTAELEALKVEVKREIDQLMPDSGNTQVARQNMLSAGNKIEKKDIDEQLQTVIRDLKGGPGLEFHLKRETVIDLLG